MPAGIMPSQMSGQISRQRIEKWPTLAYRILFFRSARAPDSRRPDIHILRSDCE
jgi:hypothetical protein